jgi:hypothetical protein
MLRIQFTLIPILFFAVAGIALGADHRAARLAEIAIHPEVRREIGLTPAQGRRLDEIVERVKQGAEPRPNLRSEVTELLKPVQYKRLEQIYLQVFDALALEDADLVKALGLDEAQHRRLDEAIKVVAAEERKMVEVMKRARFPTAEARHRFVEKSREAANARVLGILDDKQKARLETMKGKPFPAVTQVRSQTLSTPGILP